MKEYLCRVQESSYKLHNLDATPAASFSGHKTHMSRPLHFIVSAARSLTCRDDLNSKWRLLLAENELSRVSLLSQISIGN